jgi:pimeloyl-ACP methyl ester carboxylesterase
MSESEGSSQALSGSIRTLINRLRGEGDIMSLRDLLRAIVASLVIGLPPVPLASVSAATATTTHSPNIVGTWQGTLQVGPRSLRIVVQISRADKGSWKATLYSIDASPDPIPVSALALNGPNLKLAVGGETFEGVVSVDGATIEGTLNEDEPRPLTLHRATKATAWPLDPSPHIVRFVTVGHDVKLEVLDWGGSGSPLVLLTGLGNTAHVYDQFAPKLAASYHVYGITRRGFGASSAPSTGYNADRLGDDVLEVIHALNLTRPVLVGHSIAGEELSSIGSRHPEKVAGLVYLDAGYAYAFFDPSVHGLAAHLDVQLDDLRRKLEALQAKVLAGGSDSLAQELLTEDLPGLAKDLQELQADEQALPPSMRATRAAQAQTPAAPAVQAIRAEEQKFSALKVPVLAIFAVPHDFGSHKSGEDAAWAAYEARDTKNREAQVAALARAMPSAHIVRLPHANHYVFRSNETDVLREIQAFVDGLPSLPTAR